MAITVAEVMQVPYLDGVRIGQDLYAFHLAIIANNSETEQIFYCKIYLLFVGKQTVR